MQERDTSIQELPDAASLASGLGALVIVARGHGLNLSVPQLIRENRLDGSVLSIAQLSHCAKAAGLNATVVKLDWKGLQHLKKALPCIVRLSNGSSMVLVRVEPDADTPRIILQDPASQPDALLPVDQPRFEETCTGEVLLVQRDYAITDEAQPFGFGLIRAFVFRERGLVRDLAISALVLSFLALAPVMFYRLLADHVILSKTFNTFVVLCTVMVVLIGFETAFGALRRHLLQRIVVRLDIKLSNYLFDKLLNLPIHFFESTPVGLITHKINQLSRFRVFLMGQVFGTALDAGILLFFIPVMFMFSPALTLFSLSVGAVIFAWIVAMLPAYRRRSSALESAEASRGAFLSQNIHGIRTVKSLALDSKQRHEWQVQTARIAQLRLAESRVSSLIQSVVTPLERIMISGAFALGTYIAITSSDPVFVGSLFSFLLLSQRIAQPLIHLSQLIQQYDEARIAIAAIASMINQPSEEGRSGRGVRVPLQGLIEFSKVTFKYPGSLQPALRAVAFEVPQGTTLGIMGRSGSGKTTITRLLQRLHSDYQGLIKVDGIDVREYDIDHLRASIGVVLQENFLFSGTIRDNITAAKSDATFEEMVYAARLAGAEEFIDKLPRGYETYIYEGSPNLSGGQRQRLAIARALITNPRVLILDEATSALDAESEAIVNANLRRIAAGRTMLVISHRLSSLVSADAILVLDKGEVHDIGKHEELLERCDIYSGLWYTQNPHTGGAAPARPRLIYGGASDGK